MKAQLMRVLQVWHVGFANAISAFFWEYVAEQAGHHLCCLNSSCGCFDVMWHFL